MFSVFKEYISAKIRITNEDWDLIGQVATLKKIRKQQYLLQEGDIWRYHAFVCKGCLRRYRIDDKGHEHILQFNPENWWAGDRESLMNASPSKYNIDAIEESVVLLIRKEDFDTICKQVAVFNELVNAILQRSLNASQDRIHAAISLTAEEKYLHFLESFPGLANRIPRHMIASYLGITPETLSRVRAQLSGK